MSLLKKHVRFLKVNACLFVRFGTSDQHSEQCNEFTTKYGTHPFNGERSASRGKQKIPEADMESAQARTMTKVVAYLLVCKIPMD